MNILAAAAREVCDFMGERQWQFCLVGGLAVERWGEPRTTLDAGFTLWADWGDEEHYLTSLLESFEARLSGAEEYARTHRVVLIRASNGVDVDVILGALPFEAAMIERAKPEESAPGVTVPCCSAEDLSVMKAFAGRPRDWVDAESIPARQTNLDCPYVLEHLHTLCELKEDMELYKRAKKILESSR